MDQLSPTELYVCVELANSRSSTHTVLSVIIQYLRLLTTSTCPPTPCCPLVHAEMRSSSTVNLLPGWHSSLTMAFIFPGGGDSLLLCRLFTLSGEVVIEVVVVIAVNEAEGLIPSPPTFMGASDSLIVLEGVLCIFFLRKLFCTDLKNSRAFCCTRRRVVENESQEKRKMVSYSINLNFFFYNV